jgi:hypothetical protein
MVAKIYERKSKITVNDLPAELKPLTDLPNWVIWRWEQRNGKLDKPPYQVRHPEWGAKSNDPTTWATYEEAVAAVAAHKGAGIGFAITNTNIAFPDLDDCRNKDSGVIEPWAQALVDQAGSYAEVSVSGTGLHIIGYGSGAKVTGKRKKANGASVEIFRSTNRFMYVTGESINSAGLINIDTFIDEFSNNKPSEADKKTTKKSNKGELPKNVASLLHITGTGEYPSRSELLFAFIRLALNHGIDENSIIAACLDNAHAGHGIYEHVRENGGEDYVKRQIEHALNESTPVEGNKTSIKIKGGNRHEAVEATEKALLRAGCPIFFRGDALVQPLWRWERTAQQNRDTLVTKFVRFNVPRLAQLTAKQAVGYLKYSDRKKLWVPIDPPNNVIETLLELGYWDFPTVVGIVNSPTMRSDGSLITKSGYDLQTQLWYQPAGDIELPPIAEQPTKADAEASLQLLNDLLSGFPFVNEVDRSVALAAILTTTLRGAFAVAPMFLFLAPESGTGKTYLVSVISTIATGRAAPALAGCSDPNEMEKRLSAAAFEAMPILSLNNLSFDLESDLLCQMTSDREVKIRRFGVLELIRCDCSGTTAFANGNNIRVVGDLVRRTLTCHLDAKMETPESRSFEFDPVVRVKADRGRYLAAVFTIARAYMAAGCPDMKATNLAGFDDWSKMVRSPLLWLGISDPVASMAEARALDPKREAFRNLIDAVLQYLGPDNMFTAARLAALAVETDNERRVYPELFELLNHDGRVTSKSVGKLLSREVGRIRNGYRIECHIGHNGNQYMLKKVGADEDKSPF